MKRTYTQLIGETKDEPVLRRSRTYPRRYRRKARILRGPALDRQVVSFAKMMGASIQASSGTTTFYITPTLGDLSGYTEITGLFDEYCILGWEITIIPTQNIADVAAVSDKIPSMWIVDDEDGSGPTTTAGFLERPTSRIVRCDRVHKHKFMKARCQQLQYANSGTGLGTAKGKTWLDNTNVAIPHYGTYFLMVNNNNMASGSMVEIWTRVFFQAKGIV